MADTIAIRRRIRSVSSTRQITKAMQLVAASKLRAATAAALQASSYKQRLDATLAEAAANKDWQLHQLVQPSSSTTTRLIVIGTDRGLVGAYHSRMEALINQQVAHYAHEGKVEIVVIGRKEAAMVARLANVEILDRSASPGSVPSIWAVNGLANRLVAAYSAGEIGRVVVLSTRFYSALRQEAEAQVLLPLSQIAPAKGVPTTLESEPEAAITALIQSWLQATLFDTLANAFASEQAMQMMAMQNATNNAGDMIDDLTLAYNTARQAAITQELAEISGGVAALS